jgi:hypothetical protein
LEGPARFGRYTLSHHPFSLRIKVTDAELEALVRVRIAEQAEQLAQLAERISALEASIGKTGKTIPAGNASAAAGNQA